MKSFSLKNLKAKTSAAIIDLTYMVEGDTVIVISRQADFDQTQRLDRQAAREHYAAYKRAGWIPVPPVYTSREVDAFGRVEYT